ncbi:MAG TPA: hypothetical protein VIV06_09980 [Candidatus Limnocylindrales bacterium]
MEKTVDDLVEEVRADLSPIHTLHHVASVVWQRAQLDDGERQALENVAFGLLIDEGEPEQLAAGEKVMAMVRSGAHYDRGRLDAAERDRLAYLGFLAMAADAIATGSEVSD